MYYCKKHIIYAPLKMVKSNMSLNDPYDCVTFKDAIPKMTNE